MKMKWPLTFVRFPTKKDKNRRENNINSRRYGQNNASSEFYYKVDNTRPGTHVRICDTRQNNSIKDNVFRILAAEENFLSFRSVVHMFICSSWTWCSRAGRSAAIRRLPEDARVIPARGRQLEPRAYDCVIKTLSSAPSTDSDENPWYRPSYRKSCVKYPGETVPVHSNPSTKKFPTFSANPRWPGDRRMASCLSDMYIFASCTRSVRYQLQRQRSMHYWCIEWMQLQARLTQSSLFAY